jgi:hypothetical protein
MKENDLKPIQNDSNTELNIDIQIRQESIGPFIEDKNPPEGVPNLQKKGEEGKEHKSGF